MNLYDEFAALVDALNETGLNYALCGGIAVAFYGHVRFTKDIDLLILTEDVPAIRGLVQTRGFLFDSGPMPFDPGTPKAREIRRFTKIEGTEVLVIDCMLVTPLFESVWDERLVIEWEGRQVQIVALEGLATMKRLANRDQDRMDLKNLGLTETGDDE